MFYLTRMVGKPVVDATGETIGTIKDVAIATGEIFPRVTALAFQGPAKTPFMLSWRKYVDDFDGERVTLTAARPDLRFSYLQPDEVLLARDLLDKQIVDTQGMKVVRVNDLKLSESRNQLRLLGAEVGARGILRGIHPGVERAADAVLRAFRRRGLSERLIAWNYMDLLDRDLSHVKLSVTHKRLHELHPADVADVLEQLSASQRARVFEHLDNASAAEAISELEDEYQADVIADLTNQRASDILEMMDPDDAADIIGDLPYDKAETVLRLMGLKESRQVRRLLGYKEKTAGGIMTPEVTTVAEDLTVQQVIEHIRDEAAENESIYYVYVVGDDRTLDGVISLRDLIVARPDTPVADIVEHEVFTVGPDDDQEYVADQMSKYDLLAIPVVDEGGRVLGIVTVDDALDVMEEESAEDLALATGMAAWEPVAGVLGWIRQRTAGWLLTWAGVLFALALALRVLTGGEGGPDVVLVMDFAVLFLAVILRLSEDISGHALAQLIEEVPAETRPSLYRRFLEGAASGLALGLVLTLLAFALYAIVRQPVSAVWAVASSLGAAALVMSLAGAAVTGLAERREGERRLSGSAVRVGVGVLGVVVYAALVALLLPLLVSVP